MIFSALKECYDNVEMPNVGMALVDKIQSYNFKNDYGFELCYQRSWMYHRNRFFTSQKYNFLKTLLRKMRRWLFNGVTTDLHLLINMLQRMMPFFGSGKS